MNLKAMKDIEIARSEARLDFFYKLENKVLYILKKHSQNSNLSFSEFNSQRLKEIMEINYIVFSRVLVSLIEKGFISVRINKNNSTNESSFENLFITLTKLGLN